MENHNPATDDIKMSNTKYWGQIKVLANISQICDPTPITRSLVSVKETRMISDSSLAKEISTVMLEYGARLDDLVARAQSICPDAEFQNFRRAVGAVMGEMLTEVMNPLYAKHPNLKPRELVCMILGSCAII